MANREAAIRAISRDNTLSEREKMELLRRVVEQLRTQPKEDELTREFRDRTEVGFEVSRLSQEDRTRLKFEIGVIESDEKTRQAGNEMKQQFMNATRTGCVDSGEDTDRFTDIQQAIRNGISRTGKSSGLTQAQIDKIRASEETDDGSELPADAERERLRRKISELKRTTFYAPVSNPWG